MNASNINAALTQLGKQVVEERIRNRRQKALERAWSKRVHMEPSNAVAITEEYHAERDTIYHVSEADLVAELKKMFTTF